MAERAELPDDLAIVPVDAIEPCPIQPRVNVSVDLINRLATSMKEGRHEPVIEVERVPGRPDRFQVLCGEQRWRAAKAAGLSHLLVRVHRRLGYLERFTKQYEENRLRADLDPVEEGHFLVGFKLLKDIAAAERLLKDSLVPFEPLDDKRIEQRDQFTAHLEEMRRLMRKHHLTAEPLSTWAETEKALAISESQRKAKVGILRLDPDLQEAVRELPIEHAVQISRLPDRERQAALIERAPELTRRALREAVERLREDDDLGVDAALEGADAVAQPVDAGEDSGLAVLADLCRQLVRLLLIIRGDEARRVAVPALRDLRGAIDGFLEAA